MNSNDRGSLLLYTTADGGQKIEVHMVGDTVWLSADQMAELFQRNKSTISRHIKKVLDSGELQADSTVAFFATVQQEGARTVERKPTRDILFHRKKICDTSLSNRRRCMLYSTAHESRTSTTTWSSKWKRMRIGLIKRFAHRYKKIKRPPILASLRGFS